MSTRKKPLWKPCNIEETNVAKFIAYVNRNQALNLRTYDHLHAWSTDANTASDFWRLAYAFLELAPVGGRGVGRVLDSKIKEEVNLFPPPRFFPDTTLNIAELIFCNGRKDDEVAIHFAREGYREVSEITWGEIRERTKDIRHSMLNAGVKPGDVVAAVISNSDYAVCICLATLSIGAIWSSSSPDLGPVAIVDRYAQINPKLIFADDGYYYAGKSIQLHDRIAQWSHALGGGVLSLQNVVIVPYRKLAVDVATIYRGCLFERFLDRPSVHPLEFELVPFAHPAFILFSSGTTGKPKCIVHSTGGAALKVRIDSVLQHDIRKDDVVFQYTTTSWVMWVLNFINLGACRSMLLYDGSPFHPTPTVLLKLAQDIGVTVFGTSPRYLANLRSKGIIPRQELDLRSLRVMTSTGAVLSAELYEWFYREAFPRHAHLISMSGGTDIVGSFVGGSPILPVYAGEIQAKALGMAVDVFDAGHSKPLSVEQSGATGELVCTMPFPSQPLEFHGPGGFEKYRDSYFGRFGTGVWCQGDLIQRARDTGGIMMLGRSDGVLNPSGVRFGSAEIYAVTESFSEIQDSICVGQRRQQDKDERVLLFVKMREGSAYTSELERRLKSAIRDRYTPRHVPRYIFEVPDIPYTVNGKKCEINVKHIICGRNMAVSGTVGNPAALEVYREFQNLPTDRDTPSHRENKL